MLKQTDIVVTNPPFSLFREYVAKLMQYGKKFLILGNKNAVTYKEIFPLIRDNRLWIGVTPMSREIYFDVPKEYIEDGLAKKKDRTIIQHNGRLMARSPSIWYTNLDHKKRHEEFILYKSYSPEEFPKYDNYDAIEVSKTDEIPCDYYGLIGVPKSFLDKYNPEQFEIVGKASDTDWCREAGIAPMGQATIDQLRKQGNMAHVTANMNSLYLIHDGKVVLPYARIIIRRRK